MLFSIIINCYDFKGIIDILNRKAMLFKGDADETYEEVEIPADLKDLIEEVGADALRYFYVDKSLSTHMDLNLDLMKQKSNENPVFYAQYAHARIKSIFAKYEESNKEVSFVNKFNNLNLSSVKDLCLVLLQYQSVVEECATKRLVHKMTHYINELAYQLHSFYNEEKVITENDELTKEKLTVLKAVEIVLKDALSLIGVSAPDKM